MEIQNHHEWSTPLLKEMLDISISEIAVLGVAAYFFLGRSDALYASRAFGRFIGRAVIRLDKQRSKLHEYLNSEEMQKINPELREGLKKFQRLQFDLRSATLNPMHSFQAAMMNMPIAEPPANEATKGSDKKNTTTTTRGATPQVSIPRTNIASQYTNPVKQEATSSMTSMSQPHSVVDTTTGAKRKVIPHTETLQGGSDIILRVLETQREYYAFQKYMSKTPHESISTTTPDNDNEKRPNV